MTRWNGLWIAAVLAAVPVSVVAEDGLTDAFSRIVKLYGAGGIGRLEGFGTGVLLTPDGVVATVYSPMLDTENLKAVLADGRRVKARLIGVDMQRELAALKLDAENLPYFDSSQSHAVKPGDSVWALTNLYNIATGAEPVSVQRGIVSAVASLAARKGVVELTYPGDVYILDAITNNPGAAGGALIDSAGRLVGIIGKDVRSLATNTWINFAIPFADVANFIENAKAGKAPAAPPKRNLDQADRRDLVAADLRGILTLPDILDRTPAFVDDVEPESPAAKAGLRSDDLVLFVGETLIQSVRDLRAAMLATPADQPVTIAILRGESLLKIPLPPRK